MMMIAARLVTLAARSIVDQRFVLRDHASFDSQKVVSPLEDEQRSGFDCGDD